MAETSQLSRISDLVERLQPLAGRRRGMRIEADEWNALVEVLLGVLTVDRAQEDTTRLTLADRYAARDHQHTGEITDDWLSDELRSRMAGGGGSVAVRGLTEQLDARIQGLASELARLSTQMSALQSAVDRATTAGLDQGRVVRGFETRFATVESLRPLVETLGTQVGGVGGKVDALLELRGNLTDEAGNPLDLRDLSRQVGTLREMAKSLEGVDGQPLRLRDLEIQIRQLSDTVGGPGARPLDAIVDSVVAELDPRIKTAVEQRLGGVEERLSAERAASEDRLRTELTRSVGDARGALTQSLAEAATASETRLAARFDERLATTSAQLSRDAAAEAARLVAQRLNDLPGRVKAEVATALAPATAELTASLAAEVDSRFVEVDERLGSRIEPLQARIGDLESDLPGRLREAVAAAGLALGQSLEGRVDERLSAGLGAVRSEIVPLVGEQVERRLGELDTRVESALDERLANLDQRVGRAVATATQDQARQIAEEVGAQLDQLDVSGRIQTATQALGGRLREEIRQAATEQQGRTTTAIEGTIRVLRGEIEATASVATERAVERSRQDIQKLEVRIPNLRPNSPIGPIGPIGGGVGPIR